MNFKTQSHKIPHEAQKFQEKLLLLQRNDVQAMLLQSERVLEMNFLAIWIPKLKKISVSWCPPLEHLIEIEKTVQKLNLWQKTVVDKSVWMKACTQSYSSCITDCQYDFEKGKHLENTFK